MVGNIKRVLTHPAATFHISLAMYPIVKISAAFLDASVKSQYLIQGYYARYPSYNDNKLPNSALPWSRVNDHKKKRWCWQLSLLASVVISAFFLNTATPGNKNISLIRNPDIPQSVTLG